MTSDEVDIYSYCLQGKIGQNFWLKQFVSSPDGVQI